MTERVVARFRRWFKGHRAFSVLLIVLLLAAHLACNLSWLSRDRTLRADDQGTQLSAVAHAHGIVTTKGFAGVIEVLRGHHAYGWPSASTLPWVFTALVFGYSVPALRAYNIFFLGLLLVAVYRIGRRYWGWQAGVLAAALLSFYPAIYGISRQFGADLPAAAMVALSVDAALATGRVRPLTRSLILGLCVGLGVLMRPHLLIYCAGPLLLELIQGLRRPDGRKRSRILIHALGAAAVAALVSGWWWLGRTGELLHNLSQHGSGEVEPARPRPPIVEYLQEFHHGPSAFLLLVAGLAGVALIATSLHRARSGRQPGSDGVASISRGETIVPLLVWLLVGLAVFGAIQHVRLRYLWPLLPPLALLTAAGLLSIPHRFSRRAVISVTLVTAIASWLLCSLAAGTGRMAPSVDRCEGLSICGRWEEAGPPARDGSYLGAQRVAALLRRDHGDGQGVVLRMEPLDFALLHPLVVTNAVLRIQLPRIIVTGLPVHQSSTLWTGGEDPLHAELGGIAFKRMIPKPGPPAPRCYTLRVTTPASAARLPPLAEGDAPRLLTLRVLSRSHKVKMVLHRHKRCPAPPPG
jgi:4-amino-4-deoxy-L-arabinose transferase-like glycosyltransferase